MWWSLPVTVAVVVVVLLLARMRDIADHQEERPEEQADV
jgi:hypothetical protein